MIMIFKKSRLIGSYHTRETKKIWIVLDSMNEINFTFLLRPKINPL